MLSRVFLAAGVAALAIATPALAGPGDHGHGGGQHDGGGGGGGGGGPHGGGGGGGPHGGGGGGGPHGGGGGPAFMGGGGGHGGGGPAFMGFHGGGGPHGGGGGPAYMGFRGGGHGGGGRAYMGFRGGGHGGRTFAAPQMRGYAHQQFRGGYGHQQSRMAQRGYSRGFARQRFRGGRGHQQFRMAQHQQAHGFARQQARSFAQGRGFSRQQARMAQRGNFQSRNMQMRQQQAFSGRQPNAQQFAGRGKFAGNAGQFANSQIGGNGAQFRANQMPNGRLGGQQFSYLNTAPYSTLTYGNNVPVMPFEQANRFIGAPIAQVAGIAGLAPLPVAIQYLYPDTPDYYYRYGDGYLYQVDRATDLVASLIPLLAGGFLPGQYLPVAYMSDYVPDYYGFNAFYPDYGGVCNRYYGGVIYQVDCQDGYVEDVIPMYAGGYGVGELLPTAYSYYNVPLQYRGLYYDTPESGYWYSPGAIYQYDPRTNIITSVAALMGPGLAIGQPLPVGYTVYNVPYSYRAVYYDTPSAWYRYSNGYIYQVDPVTQLVTAIVASLMT